VAIVTIEMTADEVGQRTNEWVWEKRIRSKMDTVGGRGRLLGLVDLHRSIWPQPGVRLEASDPRPLPPLVG
jgi:hypothetical protein